MEAPLLLGMLLAASGMRVTHSAALELQKQHKKYALATMCIGVDKGMRLF
jgi:acetyl-CoA acetyltransferase